MIANVRMPAGNLLVLAGSIDSVRRDLDAIQGQYGDTAKIEFVSMEGGHRELLLTDAAASEAAGVMECDTAKA